MNTRKEIEKICKREGFTMTDFIERKDENGVGASYYVRCESKSNHKMVVVLDGHDTDGITIYASASTIHNYAELEDMHNAIEQANSVADGIAELFGWEMF